MLLLNIALALSNEGFSWEIFRRYLPKMAAGELNQLYYKFGSLYRDIIWDERAKASAQIPYRRNIGWPIQRVKSNVLKLKPRPMKKSWPASYVIAQDGEMYPAKILSPNEMD